MNWKLITRLSLLLLAITHHTHSYAEAVWIDVRTAVEHSIDSIEGDIRISHGEIVQELTKLFSVEFSNKMAEHSIGLQLVSVF